MTQNTVLVVEDDDALMEALKLKLEKGGVRVLTARSGEEAINVLEKERPTLISLDLLLPKMNGLEFLQRLREREDLLDIPVIVVSVSGEEEKVKQAFTFNVVDFLVKGEYAIDDITAKILNIVEQLSRNEKNEGSEGSIGKILLVEDDEATRAAVVAKFSGMGYDIVAVGNGAEGHKKLLEGKFIGVLLDLLLPVSDGLSFLQEKQKSKDSTTVMVFTNLSQQEVKTRAMRFGANGYLIKAYHSLQEVVEESLNCFLKGHCHVDQ